MNRREVLSLVGKVGIVAAARLVPWRVMESLGMLDEMLAEAAAIPSNYQVREGTKLLDSQISALAQNATTGGDATWVISDETNPLYCRPLGVTKVLKVAVTAPGTGATSWNLRWDVTTDLNTVQSFQCPIFYAPDDGVITGWSGVFAAGQAANLAARWNYNLGSAYPQLLRKGWMHGTVARSIPGSTTGSPTLASTFASFRWQMSAPAGKTGVMYLGPTYINYYNRPKIIIWLDDAVTTQYTEGFSYMQPRGVKGSLAVTSNFGTMSQARRDEMYAAGWSFHNHSDTHPDLSLLDATSIRTQIGTCASYMRANGYTRGAQSIVYPGGAVNDLVESIAQEYGHTTGWTISDRYASQWNGIDQPMRICRFNMGSANSLATLKTKVDDIITFGMQGSFYGHEILVGATGFNTEKATFQGLVDYIVKFRDANMVDVMTGQAWLDGMASPQRNMR